MRIVCRCCPLRNAKKMHIIKIHAQAQRLTRGTNDAIGKVSSEEAANYCQQLTLVIYASWWVDIAIYSSGCYAALPEPGYRIVGSIMAMCSSRSACLSIKNALGCLICYPLASALGFIRANSSPFSLFFTDISQRHVLCLGIKRAPSGQEMLAVRSKPFG